MSRQVDERVVSMQFDNQRFEKNAGTTLRTLDKLKQSLRFDGATKGLENVNDAVGKFDVSNMNSGLETVQTKFSALQVVGVTALANLTNSAVNAGKKIANALTSALTQGGLNRAKNIEQAKFQLGGLGVTWDQIEGDIDYAVKGTAYGLDEAAKAASQLIASNVEVGDSMKKALRGISGVAAMTNSSYDEMAHIFTRVAGNGRVMAVDLQSIASRGLNAAAALGKHLGKTEAQIREMVSKGKIDFATFAEAMDSAYGEHAKDANKTFTGALSNMKAALARIGADVAGPGLENLRDIFNAVRVSIDDAHNSLKPFIETINKLQTSASKFIVKFIDLGGLKNIFSGIGNIFKGIWSILKPIKNAFTDIFPPSTAERIAELTKKFSELTSKFKLTDEQAEKLRTGFKGVFAIVEILVDGIKALASKTLSLLSNFKGIGTIILNVIESLGKFLLKVRDNINETNIFKKAIEALGGFIQNIIDKLKAFKSYLADKFDLKGLEGFSGILQGIWNILSKLGSKLVEFGKMIAGNLSDDKIQNAMGLAGAILLIRNAWINWYIGISAPLKRMITIFKNVAAGVKDFLGLGNSIKGSFDALNSSLWNLNRTLKYELLMNYAKALLMIAGAMLIISLIDTDKLAASLGVVTVLIGEMVGVVALLNKMTTVSLGGKGISGFFTGLTESIIGISKTANMTTTMIKMASALLILAIALRTISKLSPAEMANGLLGIVVLMGVLVHATKMMATDSKEVVKGAGQMLVMALALTVLTGALKIIATMSWTEIAKGVVGLLGMTVILVAAARLMQSEYKSITKFAGQMLVMAASLTILSFVLQKIATMSWLDLGKGLAGIAASLLVMVGILAIMSTIKGSLAGSAASILIMSVAVSILAGSMQTLGNMSWESIAKSLVVMAGALIIFGAAAYALMATGATLALLALSGCIALFGIGVLAVGVGLVAAAAGIAALAAAVSAGATAIVAGLNIIILGFIDLIPAIVVALCDGLKIIVRSLIDIIVTSIPDILEGIGKLIVGVLELLVSYAPKIVELIFNFFIKVIDTIAKKLPELSQSFANLAMTFFKSVVDAFKNIDTKVLLDGLMAVGLISAVIAALAAVAVLTPLAMVGVLGMAAVVTELMIVLAAIGSLAQLPGLEWLISSGGYILEAVGTAIGQFIGGIVGGFAQGVSSSLPQIGSDLSDFMRNAADFISGAKNIDPSSLKGVAALAGVIVALTAANVIDGIASWFTGGSSLVQFGEKLAEFGPYMKEYADSISGMDSDAVVASANAAKALSELANNLPNSGGLVSLFTGDNDIAMFGMQLVPFGLCMKAYSDSIKGIDSEAIVASANAAKTLSELSDNLPNSGGVVGWFTGENNIGSWGAQLIPFGISLRAYSMAVSGIDHDAVSNSAIAAKTLVELANELPNTGGLVSYFTGDNSIAGFGAQLVPFGLGMKAYSKAIEGIDVDAVTASANAGKTLSELASNLPNTGGLVSLFTGDNSIANFGWQLVPFGLGMKKYSDSISGIDIEAVTSSSNAAKALSELASNLPNTGGLVSLFTGDNSIANFGSQLVYFGMGMKAYSDAITADGGINADAIIASSSAAQALSELASNLPDTGGLVNLFTGEQNLANFGWQLVPFGLGMKAYSDAISANGGINPDAITASATAAKALAEVANILSADGGSVLDAIKSIFSEDNSLATFVEQLTPFGEGMKAYSDAVTADGGINAEAVTASAGAAKTLAEMVSVLPEDTDRIIGFGDNLASFADDIKTYFDDTSEISDESITKSKLVSTALTELSESTKSGGSKLKTFGKNIKEFADKISDFSKKIGNVSEGNINNAISKVKKLIELSDTISNDDSSTLKSFASSLKTLAEDGISKFVSTLNGMTSKNNAKEALEDLITSCKNAIETKTNKEKFKSAGKYLIEGLAEGIKAKKSAATKAAQNVADAVEQIIRSAWQINSPSKVFYRIALGIGEGMEYALSDSTLGVKNSARDLADTTTKGFGNAISKINDMFGGNFDAQPTIRPVLDLSDVRAGANSIAGMFSGNRTLAVSAPGIGAISASMANRQNGNNDLASAINKLAKTNGKSGDTYNFNGFSYSEGSDVADAIQTLVRAAKMEGRT